MPQSPTIIEAHDFIRREITSGKALSADRLAVLNSAMSFVTHLSQTTKLEQAVGSRGARVTNLLEDISFPSVEMLYWMLRGKTTSTHDNAGLINDQSSGEAV